MNLLQQIEREQVEKLTEGKTIPDFAAGDTMRVNVRIVEGATERVQAFEGICIGRKNAGLHSSFTIRKISHGEGVERTFPLYSPRLESIELVRRGEVRRAKLYYLRGRTGKSARIREKLDFSNQTDAETKTANDARKAEAKTERQAKNAENRAARKEKKAAKATAAANGEKKSGKKAKKAASN